MTLEQGAVWLAAGVRTPFANVDGAFANRDAVALSVPVAQAMASRVKGPIDFAVWGWVAQNLNYVNLAREIWFDAKLDPHVPSFTTVMQCSTSMVGRVRSDRHVGLARSACDGRRRGEHDRRSNCA